MTRLVVRFLVAVGLSFGLVDLINAGTVDRTTYHLGVDGFPEWQEFAGKKPHDRQLEVRFLGESNATAQTLFLRQRDVKQNWRVLLNGKSLGSLVTQETPLVHMLAVPAGGLRAGTNLLAILPPKAVDDIEVGEFWLEAWAPSEVLARATLTVKVTDAASNGAVPCRLTVLDNQGALAALRPATTNLAEACSRPGVVYSADGEETFGVLPGTYTVFASRGFEFSVATQSVTVAERETKSLDLKISREVPTEGWISADTHIHTLTHSKHGDALMAERMLTIAGEGIELAVATDHNHHADYTADRDAAGLGDRFKGVIGNEVTTTVGHFNAFPIDAGAKVVNHQTNDWSVLLRDMRATPGVQVISLNHPRDLHSGFIPLGATNFNPVSGAPLRGLEFSFDALEVITSAAMQSDVMLLFHDWFALLNHGFRLTALASSDTHDVSRFILGQGRTYIQCDDREPGQIEVGEACQSLRNGRALVSLGLLVQLKVNDLYQTGDFAPGLHGDVTAEAVVLGPSWIQADRVELYANGLKLAEQTVKPTSAVTKSIARWKLPRLNHDVFLVAIASGPGVTAPFWEMPRPYQPSSKEFIPRNVAANNPIWLDLDLDGQYTSARAYAQRLYQRHARDAKALLAALTPYDEAVVAQVASLSVAAGDKWNATDAATLLAQAAPSVRRGFEKYLKTMP